MSITDIDSLFSSGAPGFFNRDTPVGASISGTVVSISPLQATDFATKALETWDDGRPKMLLALTVASNLRNSPDDNGHRTIYIKTWGNQAAEFKRAVQAVGGPTATVSAVVQPGAGFTATYTGEEPSKFGSPTKLYTYQVHPGAAAVDAALPAQAPQQPPIDPWANAAPQQPAWSLPPVQAPAAPVQQVAPQYQAPQAPVAQQIPQQPQPIQQAPQPVAAAPIQAPAQPAAPQQDPTAIARQLIAVGQDDATIAAHTGLDPPSSPHSAQPNQQVSPATHWCAAPFKPGQGTNHKQSILHLKGSTLSLSTNDLSFINPTCQQTKRSQLLQRSILRQLFKNIMVGRVTNRTVEAHGKVASPFVEVLKCVPAILFRKSQTRAPFFRRFDREALLDQRPLRPILTTNFGLGVIANQPCSRANCISIVAALPLGSCGLPDPRMERPSRQSWSTISKDICQFLLILQECDCLSCASPVSLKGVQVRCWLVIIFPVRKNTIEDSLHNLRLTSNHDVRVFGLLACAICSWDHSRFSNQQVVLKLFDDLVTFHFSHFAMLPQTSNNKIEAPL